MKLISRVVKKVEDGKREEKTESDLSSKPVKRKKTFLLLLFIGVFFLVIGEGYLLWSSKNKTLEPSPNKPRKSLSLRTKEIKNKASAPGTDSSSVVPQEDSTAQVFAGEKVDSVKVVELDSDRKLKTKKETGVNKVKILAQSSPSKITPEKDIPLQLPSLEKESSKEIPKSADISTTEPEDKKEQPVEKKTLQKMEQSFSAKNPEPKTKDTDAQKSLSQVKSSAAEKLVLSTPLPKEDSKSRKNSSDIEKNQLVNNYFEFGLKSQRSGDSREAEECYLKALELDPDFHPARLNLSSIYLEKGKIAEAEKELNRLLSQTPEETKVLYNMALLCYRKKEYKNAEEYLNRLLVPEPANSKTYLLKGKILESQNELDQAIKAYSKAYQIDTSDPRAIYSLGRAKDLRGEKKEALSYYSLFLKNYSGGDPDLKRGVRERINFLNSGGKDD
jgi:tetratricopeptide (TPR) repeat protein